MLMSQVTLRKSNQQGGGANFECFRRPTCSSPKTSLASMGRRRETRCRSFDLARQRPNVRGRIAPPEEASALVPCADRFCRARGLCTKTM
jgi:hypothetical protein